MKLVGASVSLATLSGCVLKPNEPILPYVRSPGALVPGEPTHYATAMTLDGYATGLLVECRDGRPLKIEGNPEHPASLGAAGVYEQASLLQLYDPARARGCRVGSRATTWANAAAHFGPTELSRRTGTRGTGLRLLLEPTSSPVTASLLARVRERYPEGGVHFYAACAPTLELRAAHLAFGQPLITQRDLTEAALVVSLGADFLARGPYHLRHARDWGARRTRGDASALYVAESMPSSTGTLATARLPLPPDLMPALALELWRACIAGADAAAPPTNGTAPLPGVALDWIAKVAPLLRQNGGRSIVIAGAEQPLEAHLAAHAINAVLGNVGRTVWYTRSPILEAGEPSHDLGALSRDLGAGAVDTLLIGAVNPCYTAPSALEFARRVRGIRNSFYLGAYDDETAAATMWHGAAAHFLESWGDARAANGTISTIQPLIAPMYDGHTVDQMLAMLIGLDASPRELLRQFDPDAATDGVLRAGLIAGSAFPRVSVSPNWQAMRSALIGSPSPSASAITLCLMPDHAVFDGRFAGNPWLQELPDPVTKLTWDNAALMAPALAKRLAIHDGDVLTLRHASQQIEVPALVVPGHADRTVSLAIGYGRRGPGLVSRRIGVDATPLLPADGTWVVDGISIAPTGHSQQLAITQQHWTMHGRAEEIFGRSPSERDRDEAQAMRQRHGREARQQTLYDPPIPTDQGFGADQWAMTIDLDLCSGCSACVVACQSENNIPVVGKGGVVDGREMHWIRIDRYLDGADDDPVMVTQPMLCQQCESAPCEYVCPVAATQHSDDGLNEMIYNRCVGTRFCSNNCPYKVRRFNWFEYNGDLSEPAQMSKNPEVTVRARGVMEKCTFCVQRIRRAQEQASIAGASETGPVMTACQQACPTGAIIFGSLTNPSSEVRTSFMDPRAATALESLDTRPRVRYLSRTRSAAVASEPES